MVGQFENSLTPCRTSGSVSTFTPLNFTPSSERISTTAAENPHWGNTGVPFMKRTTSFEAMSVSIRSRAEFDMIFLVVKAISGPSPSLRVAAPTRQAASQMLGGLGLVSASIGRSQEELGH